MKKQLFSVLLAITLFVTPVLGTARVYAEQPQNNIKDTISQVISKVGPSVVGIIGKVSKDKYNSIYGQYTPFGTGVIFKSDGHIITNSHVVAEMSDIVVVLSDGKAYKADLKLNDEKTDLAILKINKTGLIPAELGDSSDISVGETVMAIGTPMSFSLRNSATMGIISGLNRAASGDYKFIQSDVAINGGNSGGPLVNSTGKVIGINSVKMAGLGVEGLSFSIPVDTLKYIISQYERFGKVRRPFLGAELAEGVAATYGLPSNEGLTITDIEKDSPAQKSGLLSDDIITAINGVKLTSLVDYNEETKKYLPDDTVDFTVERNNTTINIKVTFSEVKDNGKKLQSEENSKDEGYSVGPDGSLNDLSFLVGGIGNTKIGHSFYGWSINVPKSSQIINDSFNAKNVVISNQARKLTIIINANPVKPNWTLKQYYDNIKDQRSYYGKVVDSAINEGSEPKYAEFVYMMDRTGGSAIRRVYTGNGYVYSFAILSEDSNPTDLKNSDYYKNLLNSFRLGFKGGAGDIKDISEVVNGKTEYSSFETVGDYDRLKTWQMYFRPDWKLLYEDPGMFYGSFGADENECIEVSIKSFKDGDDLSGYCKEIKQDYDTRYNPQFYKFLEQKPVTIGGNPAYRLVYSLKVGKNTYIYDENYIVQNGLVYKVTIDTTSYKYLANKSSYYEMLETFKPSTDDIDKIKKAVEDSEMSLRSDSLGKDKNMTDYENKKQKWSAKLPGNWVKTGMYYNYDGYEAFLNPDDLMGAMVYSYDNSKERADNKYKVDRKNVDAIKFIQTAINNTFRMYDSGSGDDYSMDADPYSVFDTVVTDVEDSESKGITIIDDKLAAMIDDYNGNAGESSAEIKKRQLAANEAAGKKFSSKTVSKEKGFTVTHYTYKYVYEKEGFTSDIQLYIFEKGNNIYYYATVLPDYLSSDKSMKLLKDIWASFKLL